MEGRMLVRVSPQWQITIPAALRARFDQTKQAEVRMENGVLMVRPVIASRLIAGEPIRARGHYPGGGVGGDAGDRGAKAQGRNKTIVL